MLSSGDRTLAGLELVSEETTLSGRQKERNMEPRAFDLCDGGVGLPLMRTSGAARSDGAASTKALSSSIAAVIDQRAALIEPQRQSLADLYVAAQ